MVWSLRYVTHSETGLVRKNNQDSGYASPRLLLVADGMGGAAAGDLASALAVDVVRRLDDQPVAGEEMLERLAGALHQANDRIADLVDTDGALDGMGTTLTGALFDGTELGLAHIGDSRAYLLRDGHLERLTHDHSWVQSLVDDGKISEDEAALHPHRSLLLKVLNGQPASDPDLTRIPLRVGDRLLLCSDGLSGLVEDPAIEAALRLPDLEHAQATLVAAAHAAGGIDNITLILADVIDNEPADPVAPVVLGAAEDRKLPQSRAATAHDDTETDLPPTPAAQGDQTGVVVRAGVAPDEEDEARYSPRAPHRRRLLRPLVGALALLLLIGAGLGAGWVWTRSQFYVGAQNESVAIFQGVAESVPGLTLSRVYEVQSLAVASLPPYYQEKVRAGIAVSGLAAARSTVVELAAAAERCATGAPPPAAPTPREPATPRPTLSAAPRTPAVGPSANATPGTPAEAVVTPRATPPGSAPEQEC